MGEADSRPDAGSRRPGVDHVNGIARFVPRLVARVAGKRSQSVASQAAAAVQGMRLQESMQAGQTWGAAIGREVGESLSRSGVKPPNPN